MTQEQKAKAYDKALERARELYNSEETSADVEIACEIIFPELKESDDEKIRKQIRELLLDAPTDELRRLDIDLEKAFNWIEKQNERKSINDTEVEPKFKVGDFVVINGFVLKILDVRNDLYETTFLQNGELRIYDTYVLDKDAHLWSIQDAKDGDVLACGDKVTDCPFIFHNLTEKLNPRSYCGVNTSCQFQVNDENGGNWCDSDEVRPATKEQRELLFQKMKEEGYEWDAEKNELKKIEEEYNGEDYGIDGLWHAKNILEKTLGSVDGYQSDDGILEHSCAISAVKKLCGQKPVWSEEDERIYHSLLADIRARQYGSTNTLESYYNEQIDWLESLKQRLKGE